jgi:hypothetical protein
MHAAVVLPAAVAAASAAYLMVLLLLLLHPPAFSSLAVQAADQTRSSLRLCDDTQFVSSLIRAALMTVEALRYLRLWQRSVCIKAAALVPDTGTVCVTIRTPMSSSSSSSSTVIAFQVQYSAC